MYIQNIYVLETSKLLYVVLTKKYLNFKIRKYTPCHDNGNKKNNNKNTDLLRKSKAESP